MIKLKLPVSVFQTGEIPRIKSHEVLKQLLPALEDEYGLTVTIMITKNNERKICNGK